MCEGRELWLCQEKDGEYNTNDEPDESMPFVHGAEAASARVVETFAALRARFGVATEREPQQLKGCEMSADNAGSSNQCVVLG